MAALDFGMALARGMLPKAEAAQKDLLNLAGGRNVFKSEDWWNKAVDKQISSGYRELERTGKEYLMPSGEYQKEVARSSFTPGTWTTWGGMSYFTPTSYSSSPWMQQSGRTTISYDAPEGAVFTTDPNTQRKQYTTRTFDIFKTTREDFTAGELSDIEAAAKRGAQQAKRTSAESKATKRRLSRATGGLMGKARQPGDEPSTGLPALGEGGLGITGSILGGGIKL